MERSDATVYKGKMGCCMRGDKEGGVPSIRAARKDESEGGGMGSKGPRASARFQCAVFIRAYFFSKTALK